MIIRHVRLRNVKSYEDAGISFQPGINFICGENGAGKTTIIEAIGFCLFGVLKHGCKISDLLRHGRGKGSIEVRFTARDGCDYTVVREFSASKKNGVRVNDGDGQPLDLHNDADYFPWFRSTAGLEPDMEPKDLFAKVIGISQNTFTLPFLMTETDRKGHFDGLFRVASFRRAYLEAAGGVSELNDRIVKLDKEVALLTQRLEPLPGLRETRRELAEATATLTAANAAARAALAEGEATVARLHGLRDALTKAEVDAAAADSEATGLSERLTRLQSDGERSRAAVERLTALHPAHERWLALGGEAEAAEARVADLTARESAFAAVDRDLATLTVRVEQSETGLTRRLAELDVDQAALAADLAAAQSRAEMAHGEKLAAERHLDSLGGAQLALTGLRDALRLSTVAALAAVGVAKRLSDAGARRDELTLALLERPEIEEKAAAAAGAQAEVASHQTDLARTRERQELLRLSRQRAANGRCPFLDSPCTTVGADLAARFDVELAELATSAADQATLLDLAKNSVATAELARERLVALDRLADEHLRLAETIIAAGGELSAALARTAQLAEPARTLAEELAALLAVPAAGAGDTADTLAAAVTACEAAATAARQLATSPAPVNMVAAVDVLWAAEATTAAQAAVTAAERAERLATAALGAHEDEFRAALGSATAALQAAEALAATHSRRSADLARLADAATAERVAIARLANQRSTLAAEHAALHQALLACGDPRAELAELRREQAANAAAHEEYLRCEPEARQLDQLLAEESALSERQSALTARQAELNGRIAALHRDFDPSALASAEQTVRSSLAETAAQRQQLSDLADRAAVADLQIAELEALVAAQAAASGRLAEHREALQLLDAARQVLNAAGEPVAEHFRAQVAADADRIQRRVSGEAATLVWEHDYEVALVEGSGANARRRVFLQLSGGEQMTVALALRIALLRFLSPVRVGFFDEPTVNLDANRRGNLAETLRTLAGEVGQMILISHDDTFDAITQNVTYLRKCATGTIVGADGAG